MKQGIKEKDIRDFEKYAKKLNDVVDRIREYKPTAMAYLAEDTLNLMTDAPHNLITGKKQPENVVTYVHMGAFDGGDW